jgi:Flp pilus assembly protein TadG
MRSRERVSARRRLWADERGLVGHLAAQFIILLLLVGVLGYEAGQMALAQAKAHTAARDAAAAAADVWQSTKNFDQARTAAESAADAVWNGAQIDSMQVDQNGEVTVTVVIEAKTMLIRRIPATRDYGMQHGTEVATTSLVNH